MQSAIIDVRPKELVKKMSSKSFKVAVICGSALIGIMTVKLNMNNQVIAVSTGGFSNLDKAGNNILDVLRHIGYWIIIGTGGTGIIKCAISQDLHGIGKVVLTSVLLYASLFFLPFALRLVEHIF